MNDVMHERHVKAVHRVEVMNAKGKPSTAVLELKYYRLQVCPPIGKEKRYANLTLTVIHAQERGTPKDREAIDWYAMRWKIETFHKILKSGCRAEDSKPIFYSCSRPIGPGAIKNAGFRAFLKSVVPQYDRTSDLHLDLLAVAVR